MNPQESIFLNNQLVAFVAVMNRLEDQVYIFLYVQKRVLFHGNSFFFSFLILITEELNSYRNPNAFPVKISAKCEINGSSIVQLISNVTFA